MNAVPETKLGTTIVNHVLGDRGSRHLPSYLQPSTGRNINKPEMAQTMLPKNRETIHNLTSCDFSSMDAFVPICRNLWPRQSEEQRGRGSNLAGPEMNMFIGQMTNNDKPISGCLFWHPNGDVSCHLCFARLLTPVCCMQAHTSHRNIGRISCLGATRAASIEGGRRIT